MKTSRKLTAALLAFAAVHAFPARSAHAQYKMSAANIKASFCYSTTQPQTILQNEVATLTWDQYGDLSVVPTTGATPMSWGIGSSTPLTGSNAGELCYDNGLLEITNSAGDVVWSSTGASTGPTFTGCYADEATRDLPLELLSNASNLTPALCATMCAANNQAYAGLQNGDQCFCGQSYGAYGTSTSCTTTCSGGSGTCGGTWASDVYQTSMPAGFVGCYADSSTRDLPYAAGSSSSMTAGACRALCLAQSYAYSGVQDGSQCFCGNSYGSQGASTGCTATCSGDGTQVCGGAWANDVFSTCPDGQTPSGGACAGTRKGTALTLGTQCNLSAGSWGTTYAGACDRLALDNSGTGWCAPATDDTELLWNDGNGGGELFWTEGYLSYTIGEHVIWSTPQPSPTYVPSQVCFQGDGNLVIYDASGAPLWAAGTSGQAHTVNTLTVDACGASLEAAATSTAPAYIYWRDAKAGCAPSSVSNNWCRSTSAPGTLLMNQGASLVWTSNGQLELENAIGNVVWSTPAGGAGSDVCFQNDGNLVVYNASNGVAWAANCYDEGVETLSLAGGTLAATNAAGTVLWSQSVGSGGTQVPGGGFSYVFDKSAGDSNFGAEVWAIGAATNAAAIANLRASVPAGSTASSELGDLLGPGNNVPSGFAEVLGNFGASATVFSKTLTILDVGGDVSYSSAYGIGDDLSLTVTGTIVQGGTIEPLYTWSVDQIVLEAQEDFTVVVVPVTVDAEVTGTLGVTATLGLSFPLTLDVVPSADLTVDASAGVGTSEVSAGVEGSLMLLGVDVPLDLSFNPSDRMFTATSSLDLSTLSGDLGLYAQAGPIKYTYTLASWDGLNYAFPLLSTAGAL